MEQQASCYPATPTKRHQDDDRATKRLQFIRTASYCCSSALRINLPSVFPPLILHGEDAPPDPGARVVDPGRLPPAGRPPPAGDRRRRCLSALVLVHYPNLPAEPVAGSRRRAVASASLFRSETNAGDRLIIVDFFSPGCADCHAHRAARGRRQSRSRVLR